MLRRRRGVGLLGTAAIAGTAAYAGNRVAKSAAQDQQRDQQIADLQSQVAAQQAAPPPPPPAAAAPVPAPPPAPAPAAGAPSMDDKIAQLQQLAELKTAGVLTDAEFEAQKAKILAG